MADPPRILVLQHVSCEPLGTLGPILAQASCLRVLAAYEDPVAYGREVAEIIGTRDYDGVVALGGPMAVYERDRVECLEDSLRVIRAALRLGAPILGICLGAQLLAWTLGSRVRAGRTLGLPKEIGWYPVSLTRRGSVDPAFHAFRAEDPVFHWHGDTFDLPPGAWHLAASKRYLHQAFRWGRWAYGIQFHVEVTAAMVAEWMGAYAGELAALDYVDRAALVREARVFAPLLEPKARILAGHFAECAAEFARERVVTLLG